MVYPDVANFSEREENGVRTFGADCDSDDDSNAIVLSDEARNQPSFGNICVENSSDVHFGNKAYYQGPVTIKQFVSIDTIPNQLADVQNLKLKAPELGAKLNETVIINGCANNNTSDNVGQDREAPTRSSVVKGKLLTSINTNN